MKEENQRLNDQLKEAKEAAKQAFLALQEDRKKGMLPLYVCFFAVLLNPDRR